MIEDKPFYERGVRRRSTHGNILQGHTICFSGLESVLVRQISLLTTEQRNIVRHASIRFSGEVVQDENLCCVEVVMASSMFVFPLLLLLCDCYRRRVARLSKLKLSSYQLLARTFVALPNLESLSVQVEDSYFNQEKAKVLEQSILKLPSLRTFTFDNYQEGINVEDRNYSRFQQCFLQIRAADNIAYRLQWDRKIFEETSSLEDSSIHMKPRTPKQFVG